MPLSKRRLALYLSVLVILVAGKFGYPEIQLRLRIAKLPEPAQKTTRYSGDVHPILEHRCYRCHGSGKGKGGLSLADRDRLLTGSDNGVVVKIGNSKRSRLIHLIAAGQGKSGMPPTGSRLLPTEVAVLMAWIDQGLVWEDLESESDK